MTLCATPTCDREATVRDRCRNCDRRLRVGMDMSKPVRKYVRYGPDCKVEGCPYPHSSHGYCGNHAAWFRRHGKHPTHQVCQPLERCARCDRKLPKGRLRYCCRSCQQGVASLKRTKRPTHHLKVKCTKDAAMARETLADRGYRRAKKLKTLKPGLYHATQAGGLFHLRWQDRFVDLDVQGVE